MNNIEWLIENGGTPIRYRAINELLGDRASARKMLPELMDNDNVCKWLKNLSSADQAGLSEVHGGTDLSLENSISKLIWLGLDASMPELYAPLARWTGKFTDIKYDIARGWATFNNMILSNYMLAAGFTDMPIVNFARMGLDAMYEFVSEHRYDIYISDEARKGIKKPPKCWADKPIIDPEIHAKRGFCYPLRYDIVGMYSLTGMGADEKIDAVIRHISTDAFHEKTHDNYGLLLDQNGYHAMGWDPRYPGWFGIDESTDMPKLLFFAMYAVRYPYVRTTKWFSELIRVLDSRKTDAGRYVFPAEWLAEKSSYAITGGHLSFGENRRNRNWRAIESTFYMEALKRNAGM